ncbi:phage tail protein [Limnoglobus roseus]|uniref:Phage tail protein n=1 Tax=Limnoglobus roseus TaxID=2598579 RepID=A0A5C1ACT1_9BACT|nr:phage tail protein [Limnoglobus roseus]QEL17101.1 hypothetical protein PX52LOC_04078 [Limnoglobus roseus]
MADRGDPYEGYNFLVEIDGLSIAGFTQVSGLESRIEVVEYRDGGEKFFPARKLPGKVTYTNIVLKSGITDDTQLYDWHLEWVKRSDSAKRKSIRIVLLDGAGKEKRSWRIREAWPAVYVGPSLNAGSNDVLIQTIELAHEGIDLD